MWHHLENANLTDWHITTLFHWGENPTGKWELEIRDAYPGNPSTGKLFSWSLILYGTSSAPLALKGEEDNPRTPVIPTKASSNAAGGSNAPTTKPTKPAKRFLMISVPIVGALLLCTAGICYLRYLRKNRTEDKQEPDKHAEPAQEENEREQDILQRKEIVYKSSKCPDKKLQGDLV